jgi:hypothetical protein
MFAEQLKARGDKLLRYPPAPPPDLSPPPQARAALGCGARRALLRMRRSWGRLTGRRFRHAPTGVGVPGACSPRLGGLQARAAHDEAALLAPARRRK